MRAVNGTPVRVRDVAEVKQGPKIRLGQMGKAYHYEDGRIVDDNDVVGGMAMMEFLMEMPLLGVLHFQEGTLPMPADDLVDGLLAKAHALE